MLVPRPRLVAVAWLLLAFIVPSLNGSGVAAAAGGAPAPTVTTVRMIHFTFDPPTVTIPVGSTVTWTYAENATDLQPGCESPEFRLVPAVSCPGHSTTAVSLGPDGKPLWDSGVHRADGFPYSHTFTKPGTYAYYCTIHGGPHANNPLTSMNGTIVVTAAAASGATPAAVASASGGSNNAGPAAPTASLPATGGTNALALGAAILLSGLTALSLRRHVLHH